MKPSKASFVFFRYTMDKDYSTLIEILEKYAGTGFAYGRGIVLEGDEKDHIVTLPKLEISGNRDINSWSIARKLKERTVVKTENENKEIREDVVPTIDEWQHTRFVFVANSKIIAVEDSYPPTGMGAQSAIRRFSKYCQRFGISFTYENISSNDDIKQALKKWLVTEFKFSIRPFNPTIPEDAQAENMHELLSTNDTGKFTGKLDGVSTGISNPDKGLINVIMQFVERDYGSVSLKGKTKEGYDASIKSETITGDKEKDARRAESAKIFRVTMTSPEEEVIHKIGKIIIEWESTF